MSWACGCPDSTSIENVQAINSEFHDHLFNCQKLLQEAQDNARGISVLEFEATRDWILRTAGEVSTRRPAAGSHSGLWEQS